MKIEEFNYYLPEELIAQDPLEIRDSSRLLVLQDNQYEHHQFGNLVDFLREGDCLVLNNTRVIPARLFGEKVGTRANVEVLLLREERMGVWEALVQPGKRLKEGHLVSLANGELLGKIIEVGESGLRLIEFEEGEALLDIIKQHGEMPLPPYIRNRPDDPERYQTVYSKEEGSVAAPTAGLHFTPELLQSIRGRGIEVVEITLHVGLGTFLPVKVEDVEDHKMHAEYYSVSKEAAERINNCKANGGRVIAVGTTVCRTLESTSEKNRVISGSGWTDLFIKPGYEFKVVDGLVTNFHLPKSTLLLLVSALAGKDLIFRAYEEAVRERYRFFSFGDAMLII